MSTTEDGSSDNRPADPVTSRYQRWSSFSFGLTVIGALASIGLVIDDAARNLPDPMVTSVAIFTVGAGFVAAALLIAAGARDHRNQYYGRIETALAALLAGQQTVGGGVGAEVVRVRHQVTGLAETMEEMVAATARHSALMEQTGFRPRPAADSGQQHGRRRRHRPARAVVLPPDVVDMTRRLDQKLTNSK
jgi:hypothetical protein